MRLMMRSVRNKERSSIPGPPRALSGSNDSPHCRVGEQIFSCPRYVFDHFRHHVSLGLEPLCDKDLYGSEAGLSWSQSEGRCSSTMASRFGHWHNRSGHARRACRTCPTERTNGATQAYASVEVAEGLAGNRTSVVGRDGGPSEDGRPSSGADR